MEALAEHVRLDLLFDEVMAASLIVTMLILGYIALLLRNEMRSAALSLKRVLDGHAETTASIERVWSHIHELEVRVGVHQDDSSRRPRLSDVAPGS